MQIGLACDHGGVELKEEVKPFLKSMGFEPVDLGTFNEDSVDYPDYAILVAERISKGEMERGILICGTGIGMCMVANKFPWVRAALVLPGSVGSIRMRISWSWEAESWGRNWRRRLSKSG